MLLLLGCAAVLLLLLLLLLLRCFEMLLRCCYCVVGSPAFLALTSLRWCCLHNCFCVCVLGRCCWCCAVAALLLCCFWLAVANWLLFVCWLLSFGCCLELLRAGVACNLWLGAAYLPRSRCHVGQLKFDSGVHVMVHCKFTLHGKHV